MSNLFDQFKLMPLRLCKFAAIVWCGAVFLLEGENDVLVFYHRLLPFARSVRAIVTIATS